MKLENVKVGQFVKVKSTADSFKQRYIGAYGTVTRVEDASYTGALTVRVQFPDGGTSWGNHGDIKPIKV